MALDRPPGRLGPGDELAVVALAPFRGHGRDHVRERVGVRRELVEPGGPRRGRLDRVGSAGSTGITRASAMCRRVSVWVRRSSAMTSAA